MTQGFFQKPNSQRECSRKEFDTALSKGLLLSSCLRLPPPASALTARFDIAVTMFAAGKPKIKIPSFVRGSLPSKAPYAKTAFQASTDQGHLGEKNQRRRRQIWRGKSTLTKLSPASAKIDNGGRNFIWSWQ